MDASTGLSTSFEYGGVGGVPGGVRGGAVVGANRTHLVIFLFYNDTDS